MKPREKIHKNTWNSRKLWMAIFLVVFVVFYRPPIVKSIENLFRSTFHAARNFRAFQSNLEMPNAGEQMLPASVREMLALLRTHRLDTYRVSERIMTAEEALIYQRIVESAWPRRMDSGSGHEFRFAFEPATSGCTEIERKKEVAMTACVLLLYYFTILIDPLEDWDARSIWFFHAKMIAAAESIGLRAGWGHPSLRFSHSDSPNLIPALAAQLSHLLGYWNEYCRNSRSF